MSNYELRNGGSFLDAFEPDPSGPTITGYEDASGNLLRFAPISAGSKGPNVEYYTENDIDVSNIWAQKGSVAYTVPSLADVGNYDAPYTQVASVTRDAGQRLSSKYELVMQADGYLILKLTTTNFQNDTNLATQTGTRLYNYPNGLEVYRTNWAASPAPGVGSGYTVSFYLENTQWGRVNYPVVPPTMSNRIVEAGSTLGSLTTYDGSVTGLGENFPLSSDCSVFGLLDHTLTAAAPLDPNGGLSRYYRGIVRVVIRRNGVDALTFRFRFFNENRFAPNRVVDGGGGGGGGVGGGGGGGEEEAEQQIQ